MQRMLILIISKLQRLYQKMSKSGGILLPACRITYHRMERICHCSACRKERSGICHQLPERTSGVPSQHFGRRICRYAYPNKTDGNGHQQRRESEEGYTGMFNSIVYTLPIIAHSKICPSHFLKRAYFTTCHKCLTLISMNRPNFLFRQLPATRCTPIVSLSTG